LLKGAALSGGDPKEQTGYFTIDLTYEEGPGDHNWAYWDGMIQNVLAWMVPREKRS
jgi:S-formylglutathione hydrolase FrmB